MRGTAHQWALGVALALAVPGCFEVNYGDVGFECGTGGDCPSGYECCGDNRCHDNCAAVGEPDAAQPASIDAGASDPDADPSAPDAMPSDVCESASSIAQAVDVPGTTTGTADDYSVACLAVGGPDTVHSFTLGAAQAVLVTLTPTSPAAWPIAVSLRSTAQCEVSNPDLSCVASSPGARLINRPNLSPGAYSLVVDGAGAASGDYTVRYDVRPVDTTFGYWRIKTTGNAYATLTGATDVTPVVDDDTISDAIAIGFTFPYYNAVYTQVFASSNGWLSFTDPSALPLADQFGNDCPLTNTTPNDLIAVFWDDLFPDDIFTGGSPASLHFKQDGTAPNRRFSIEWVNFDVFESVPCSGGTCDAVDTLTTQMAVLHENGDIELRYGPRTAPNMIFAGQCATQDQACAATIGLRNTTGTFDADGSTCNTPDISAGDVISWIRPR